MKKYNVILYFHQNPGTRTIQFFISMYPEDMEYFREVMWDALRADTLLSNVDIIDADSGHVLFSSDI